MRIIGIDPSLTATGIADEAGGLVVKYPKGVKDDQRLVFLRDQIEAVVNGTGGQEKAAFAVVEDMPFNARNAGKTAMAHGVVRECLSRHGVFVVNSSPATVKKFATDNGRADKTEMIAAWNNEFPDKERHDDNVVDASWMRELGVYMTGLQYEGYDDMFLWRKQAASKLKVQYKTVLEAVMNR